jgi:signal recognition particle subunit SRP72
MVDLLKAAQDQLDDENFEAVLKTCKEIEESSEIAEAVPIAVKAKVFSLMQLDKYHDALQIIAGGKAKFTELDFEYERAYCLYRLNKHEEAIAAITTARPAAGEDWKDAYDFLEAQVLYRMNNYSASAAKYTDRDGEGPLTNLLASYVSGGEPEKALAVAQAHNSEVEESLELLFNLSCAQMDIGSTGAAQNTLAKARQLALQALEEDGEADGTSPELSAIDVQDATARQIEGQIDGPNEIYSRVLRPSEDTDVDVTVLAIGCNNLVALRPDGKSLFDSLKRLNVASKESLEHKLTRKQAVAIAVNKCLLLLQGKKKDECKSLLASLQTKYPGEPQLILAQAALAFAEKKVAAAEEILKAGAEAHPGCAELVLARAELCVELRQPEAALASLKALPLSSLYEAATLAKAVHLHAKPQVAEACTLLRAAVDYWLERPEAHDTKLPAVLRLAMAFAAKQRDWELSTLAHRTYLEQCDGSSQLVLARLVEALTYTDPEMAERYASRIAGPDTIELDAEELEFAPLPKVLKTKEKEAEAAAVEGAAPAAKKKKKRKIRYPKGFDPANPGPPPDPERWLPKHERAEFKKRMKKKDKNLLRCPQGAVGATEDAFRVKGPSTAQIDVSADTGPRKQKNKRKK